MTISLGGHRMLKEARVEIDSGGFVVGFLDLVGRERVFLDGRIDFFNDSRLEELKGKQKFPIIIHFKIKNYLKDGETINLGLNRNVTSEEYLEYFHGNQTIIRRMTISVNDNYLSTETSSQPYGDMWRFGSRLSEMIVLEAKNVPGMKDVEKK